MTKTAWPSGGGETALKAFLKNVEHQLASDSRPSQFKNATGAQLRYDFSPKFLGALRRPPNQPSTGNPDHQTFFEEDNKHSVQAVGSVYQSSVSIAFSMKQRSTTDTTERTTVVFSDRTKTFWVDGTGFSVTVQPGTPSTIRVYKHIAGVRTLVDSFTITEDYRTDYIDFYAIVWALSDPMQFMVSVNGIYKTFSVAGLAMPTGGYLGLHEQFSNSGCEMLYKPYQFSATTLNALSADILDGSVTTAKLADLAVTSVKIADNAVITAKLNDVAVTTQKIADLNITNQKIALLAVDTGQLANLAVTTGKITDLAVTTAKLNDLGVTTGKLNDLAVSTAKLADVAVSTAKIALLAVDTAQIANLAVSTGKMADLAVTTAKLNDLAVATGKLADVAVTTAKIADLNITTIKIADSAVVAAKVAAAQLDLSKLTSTLNAALSFGDARNRIFDPGAEANSTYWAIESGAEGSYANINDSTKAYSGNRYHKLTNITAQWAHVQHNNDTGTERLFEVNPGDVIRFGGRVYAEGAGAGGSYCYYIIREYDKDHASVINYVSGTNISAAAWTAVSDERTIPAGIRYVSFGLESYNGGSVQTQVYRFDDAFMFRETPGGDIVARTIAADRIIAATITTNEIAALTIVAGNIAAATITGAKIAAATITASNIVADTITANEIAANAIGTSELNANAVTAAKIASHTITANEIAALTITAAEIAATTITAGKLVAHTLTANEIAAATITTTEIAALTIVAGNIAASTITGGKIAATTITAANIAALTITASEIAATTITGGKLVAHTITANEIAALTITASEIAASTITGAKIAAATITTGLIAADTLLTTNLAVGFRNFLANPNPLNALKNPGAEDGQAFWHSSLVATTDSTKAHSGNKYFLKSSASDFDDAGQVREDGTGTEHEVSAGDVVTFWGWIYIESMTGARAAGFYVVELDKDKANPVYTMPVTSTIGSWVKLTGTLTCGANTKYVRYETTFRNGTGTTTARFDDMAMTVMVPGAGIVANSITAAQITAGTITTTEIAALTITGANIAATTITAAKIAALTITANEIAASTITAAKLTISTLSAIAADVGTLNAGKIQNAGATVGILLSGSLPGGWTTYLNLTATADDPLILVGSALSITANGAAVFTGTVSAASLTASGGTTLNGALTAKGNSVVSTLQVSAVGNGYGTSVKRFMATEQSFKMYGDDADANLDTAYVVVGDFDVVPPATITLRQDLVDSSTSSINSAPLTLTYAAATTKTYDPADANMPAYDNHYYVVVTFEFDSNITSAIGFSESQGVAEIRWRINTGTWSGWLQVASSTIETLVLDQSPADYTYTISPGVLAASDVINLEVRAGAVVHATKVVSGSVTASAYITKVYHYTSTSTSLSRRGLWLGAQVVSTVPKPHISFEPLTTAPTTAQVVKGETWFEDVSGVVALRFYDGTNIKTLTDCTTGRLGLVQLANDLGGTATSPRVVSAQLDDGSVGTPALRFNSDTNTGIYRAAADDLRVSAGGADVAKFTVSGLLSTIGGSTTLSRHVTFVGQVNNLTRTANTLASMGTVSLPAGSLAATGDSVHIVLRGHVAASGSAAKAFNIKFGATTVCQLSLTGTQAQVFNLDVWVVRTGATTQLAHGVATTFQNAVVITNPSVRGDATSPAETLANAITIDFLGQSDGTQSLTIDIATVVAVTA